METTQVAAAAAEIDIKNLPKFGTAMHGGKYAGVLTNDDGRAYVLVLLDEKPKIQLTWSKAQDWAAKQDGSLPNRVESAQLFRALGDEFEKRWHWTNEPCSWDASYAWYCLFDNGTQISSDLSYAGCARAVRRFVL
jgi:hypothetical protein